MVARAKAVKNVWLKIAQIGSRKIANTNFTQRVGTVRGSGPAMKPLGLARATLRTTFLPRLDLRVMRSLLDFRFFALRLVPQITRIATNLEKRNLQCLESAPKAFGVHLGSLPQCIVQPAKGHCVHVSCKLPETTGWQPVLPRTPRLRTSHICACARVDLDCLAFLNKERDVDCLSSFQLCRLGDVARSVAPHAFR